MHGRVGALAFTLRIDATLPPPALGSTVPMAVRPEHLHWFDAQTQARVNG